MEKQHQENRTSHLFQKGNSGGPGRPKNLINRARNAMHVLNKHAFDPLTEMVEMCKDEETPKGVKRDLLVCMAKMVYPQLKAIEVSNPDGEGMFNPIAEAMMTISKNRTRFPYKQDIDVRQTDPGTTTTVEN